MSKNTLYLLKYNNYYNRTIKSYDTLSEYLTNEPILASFSDLNFIPNDGVLTTHKLKYNGAIEPDYMLVVDQSTAELSRWFILEQTRTTGGQYEFTLRRDLIADNLQDILDAPVFIEKATISDPNDPAIYNNESLTFNQIKVSEHLLRDDTKMPWIVGYVPKDFPQETTTITAPFTVLPSTVTPTFSVANLADWEYSQYQSKEAIFNYNYQANVNFKVYAGQEIENYAVQVTPSAATAKYLSLAPEAYYSYSTTTLPQRAPEFDAIFKTLTSTTQFSAQVDAYLKSEYLFLDALTLQSIKDKTLYVQNTNTLYQININVSSARIDDASISSLASAGDALLDKKPTSVSVLIGGFTTNGALEDIWSFNIQYTTATIELVPYQIGLTFDLPAASSRPHTTDAPYDMFCIPYGAIRVRDNADNLLDYYTTTSNGILNLMSSLTAQLGEGAIYDIQLLPYCPASNLINYDTGYVDAYRWPTNKCTPIYEGSSTSTAKGDKTSLLMWCDTSNFTLTLDDVLSSANVPNDIIRANNPAIVKKLVNETQFMRICSPNYNGVFEFNPQKNNGLSGLQVICSYKPYTPFIQVAPLFNKGSLYGANYKDGRGLICGGDFSLPQLTDAWANYELQNKNYQKQFDRQIENMEVNNAIQREQQIWSIATGALSGAVGGALASSTVGSALGGPIAGGIAGGVGAAAGMITSVAGGVRDYQLSEELREEALDYTKDLYSYNLQNIQALPYGLSKVSPFNANNKIFPFLEFYDCTDMEKEALKNKLYYDGMTVMRIGSLQEFRQSEPSYIKGKLIRLESIGDYHMVSEIANELNKGIFI